MQGQRVGVRFIVPEQIERDWDSVSGVRSSVATHRTPRKFRRGAGKAQTRPAGAVGAGCRGISDLVKAVFGGEENVLVGMSLHCHGATDRGDPPQKPHDL
eukprot:84769-Prymnesium_polylepis.1